MGVTHRGSKEQRELRGHTPSSKLPYPPRCRQQSAHQHSKADVGRRGSRQREGLKSRRRPHPGLSSCHLCYDSPSRGSGLSHFSLTRTQELSGLCPWALLPVLTQSKVGGGWGGGNNSRVLGHTYEDVAGTPASDTPQSPTLPRTEGGSVIPDSWSDSPRVRKTLKVILCLSTFCDRRFTTPWGRPLHLGELWQLEPLPYTLPKLSFSLHWGP